MSRPIVSRLWTAYERVSSSVQLALLSMVDANALEWTLTALDEDKEIEEFVARVPGFFDSRAVPDPTSAILPLMSDQDMTDPILGSRLHDFLKTVYTRDPRPSPKKRAGAVCGRKRNLAARVIGRCFGTLVAKKLSADIDLNHVQANETLVAYRLSLEPTEARRCLTLISVALSNLRASFRSYCRSTIHRVEALKCDQLKDELQQISDRLLPRSYTQESRVNQVRIRATQDRSIDDGSVHTPPPCHVPPSRHVEAKPSHGQLKCAETSEWRYQCDRVTERKASGLDASYTPSRTREAGTHPSTSV
ncbi:hypothetical protein EDB87DRAFT_1825719, partial [Lactarius vividus]